MQYTHFAQEAEDIAQLVFLRVWEKRDSLPQIEKPESWLFIMARNEFLNSLRKKKAEQLYHRLMTWMEESRATPEQLLIARQKDQVLQQAVNRLPEKQREVYLLSRESGYTYEEIALRLNISKNTVKEHMARAIHSIKAFLQDHPDLLWLVCLICFR